MLTIAVLLLLIVYEMGIFVYHTSWIPQDRIIPCNETWWKINYNVCPQQSNFNF